MVGHKLLEVLVERGATAEWDIVTFCEESRPAYDRVNLSSFFSGTTAEDLSLVSPGFFVQVGLNVHLGDKVVSIDTKAAQVVSARGARISYDALVLATGSYPFVPPVPGRESPGCFVYRTIDDLEAIRDWAAGCKVGAVVGGGLLGLEAANALKSLGLETHVVEFAPRLMGVQVDDGGGSALQRRIEDLGVQVHTSMSTSEIYTAADGQVAGMRFTAQGDGDAPPDLPVDMVVFSAGIRPRDELAKSAGLTMGERGGVLVDDACRTSDPRIFAIGECALAPAAPAGADGNFARRRIYGLVSPGYQMARVVADRILGGGESFTGADMSTKLKLLGIDVASFGDGFGTTPGSESITYSDPVSNVYKRLVVGPPSAATSKRGGTPTRQVLGGILVGDAAMYQTLLQMSRGDMPAPEHLEQLIFPATTGTGPTVGVGALSAEATICSCNNVSKGAICSAIADGDHRDRAPQGLHQGGHRLRRLCPAGDGAAALRAEAGRLRGQEQPVRALRVLPPGAVRHRQGPSPQHVLGRAQRVRHRAGVRDLQAGGGVDARLDGQRLHPRRRAGRPPGHQRPLPRQPAAGRHLLGDPEGPRGRDHAGPAHRHRVHRQGLRALHQDHRRPAHRHVRRPGRPAPPHLEAARRRRHGVGPRLRQGVADGEVVRRHHVVPVRRPGLGGPGRRAGAPVPGPAGAAQAQVGGLGVHPRVRRGPEQGLRRDRHRAGLERLRVRQRGHEAPARRAPRLRPRQGHGRSATSTGS